MAKIIFLDIDGVLNNNLDKRFHRPFVENLNFITSHTGAKIVVSSSWKVYGLEKVRKSLRDVGVTGEVIDTTPTLSLGEVVYHNGKIVEKPLILDPSIPRIELVAVPRGLEIKYWLEVEAREPVEAYVILDDNQDLLMAQAGNYVRCSNQVDDDSLHGFGLTKRGMMQAISILSK